MYREQSRLSFPSSDWSLFSLSACFESGGELVERGLKVGNRAFNQRRQQAGEDFAHTEIDFSAREFGKDEGALTFEESEWQAARPNHFLSRKEFSNLHWKGATGAAFSVNCYFLAEGNAAIDLIDSRVPGGVLGSVSQYVPDSGSRRLNCDRNPERFHRSIVARVRIIGSGGFVAIVASGADD